MDVGPANAGWIFLVAQIIREAIKKKKSVNKSYKNKSI